MQTIQETLNRYNNAEDALYEAEQLVDQLKRLTREILDANTETITLRSVGEANPAREYKVMVPFNLICQNMGTVIRIDGAEYMKVCDGYGQWGDSIGQKVSSQDLFRRMLDCPDDCQVIAIGR